MDAEWQFQLTGLIVIRDVECEAWIDSVANVWILPMSQRLDWGILNYCRIPPTRLRWTPTLRPWFEDAEAIDIVN